jgi:hypothetical protein
LENRNSKNSIVSKRRIKWQKVKNVPAVAIICTPKERMTSQWALGYIIYVGTRTVISAKANAPWKKRYLSQNKDSPISVPCSL